MRLVAIVVVANVRLAAAEPDAAGGSDAADPELAPSDALDLPLVRSQLSIALRGTSPDDTYRDGEIAVTGALPIYGHHSGLELLAQFRLQGEEVASEMFASDQQVTEAALGITAVYHSERMDLYALYVGASIAASRDELAHAQLKPTAIGFGSYRTSADVTWIYGGGVGSALGRQWVLPAAGVMWRFARDWTVTTILPIFVQLRHAFTRHIAGEVIASVSGDQFEFTGTTDQLQLRLAQLRVGVGTIYHWNHHWSVRGELGVVGPRWITIADGDATVMSSDSRGAGYLTTKASYAF